MACKAVAPRMGGRALLSLVAMEVDTVRERLLEEVAEGGRVPVVVSPALDAAWMLLNRLAAGESLNRALDTAADLFERSAQAWEAAGGTAGVPVAESLPLPLPFEIRLDGAAACGAGSLAEAAGWWCQYRAAHGFGASEAPAVSVVARVTGKVYRVSYNGRVWAADGSEVAL